MKRLPLVSVLFFQSVVSACGSSSEVGKGEPELATDEFVQPLAADTAKGVVPTGVPSRLLVGLFEDTGGTWMRSSNAAWDVRYRYVTKGWVNNWGWGAADGGWAQSFLNETQTQGY